MKSQACLKLTWLDPKTGLEWQRQSPGAMTWYEANAYAQALALDDKPDWRLPSLKELESLPRPLCKRLSN